MGFSPELPCATGSRPNKGEFSIFFIFFGLQRCNSEKNASCGNSTFVRVVVQHLETRKKTGARMREKLEKNVRNNPRCNSKKTQNPQPGKTECD